MPGTARLTASRIELQHYLALLFPDLPDDAWLVVSWLSSDGRFCSQWFHADQGDGILQCLEDHAATCNVYVGLGVRHPACAPTPDTRGTSAQVCAINALWIEFDHNAGVHSATHLPSPDALHAFLATLPFRFSLIVDSGGGLHAYLLLKELWWLETPEDQAAAAHLLKRFQRTLQIMATEQGWHIDSTSDLARVLRPAGTFNYKQDPPRPVHIVTEDGQRYNPSDLRDAPWLLPFDDDDTPQAPHGDFPITLFPLIEQQCAWMAHCRDDAATLSEPEWYAMLGIVGRCEQGDALAQTLSSLHKGYSTKGTTKKLKQALSSAGPRTCQGIRYGLNADAYCRECPSWGTIKSPIRLGMPLKKSHDDFFAPPVGFGSPNGVVPSSAKTSPARQRARGDPEEQAPWYLEEVAPYKSKRHLIDANDTTICAFLRNHSLWQGTLWWDAMANKPMVGKEELTDYLITKIGATFGKKHLLPIRTDRMLARCLTACCYERQHDPLREYLDTLDGWDGTPRLEQWLIDCAGVVNTAYHRFVSRILLVSMIARAYDPGCLYRNVIVFEGPEEFRKSTFVAALVPEKRWHLSMTSSFENKDVPMLIQGIWVAELSELDSLSRTEETRLKSFITDTEDAYVPKWQLFRIAPKRRTIFVGTTNESTWMKSQTGNTRFLPVRIFNPMEVEEFIAIREQLFAEAKIWYGDHPHDWWDMPEDARPEALEAREERRQTSIYESDLALWLDEGRFEQARKSVDFAPVPGETTWQEIAMHFLRLDTPEKWKDQNLQKQIVHALKALKWHPKPLKRDQKNADGIDKKKTIRGWVYEPPAPF